MIIMRLALLLPFALFFIVIAQPALAQTCTSDADCETIGPGFECSDSSQCEWIPPIGIPRPEFGIEETYLMYNDEANQNPDLAYNPNSEGGFYTHYVDNSGACTDNENDYGTESNPRCSIPGTETIPLPEGSVVELHGTYSIGHSSPGGIWAQGIVDKPVFIRGLSDEKPIITRVMHVYGSGPDGLASRYIIFENLIFGDEDGDLSGGYAGGFGVMARDAREIDSHHIVLRNSEISGNIEGEGGGVAIGTFSEPRSTFSDIVIYNNEIRDRGIWDPEVAEDDRDYHGITIGWKSLVSNVWVVDNEVYHNEGDAVQIEAGPNLPRLNVHHVYVGRNILHHNKQMGVAIKNADDVVVSENDVFGHRASSSSTGAGLGFSNDGPDKAWFLFNRIYDCDLGFKLNGGRGVNGPATGPHVMLGNVIHDIHGNDSDIDSWTYPGQAVTNWGGGVPRYFIGNTIYDVEHGYSIWGTDWIDSQTIANNIFLTTGSQTRVINVMSGSTAENAVYVRNNMFYDPFRVSWGSTFYTAFAEYEAASSNVHDNIFGDPQFVEVTGNDAHLISTSPARDAGIESDIYQTFWDTYYDVFNNLNSLDSLNIRKDFDRNPRPQGTAWDIGAYEFQGSTCVDTDALLGYIAQWEAGNASMPALISRIAAWKSGAGCP